MRGDASNPQQGIATVEQLAVKDKVDMYMGTYISGISLTASDAAMRYNKLYWETNAVAVNLTERGLPNFIRSGPDGNAFAVTSVNVIRNLIAPNLKKDIKGLKVWIQHEDSIYGTGIAQVQRKLHGLERVIAAVGVAGVIGLTHAGDDAAQPATPRDGAGAGQEQQVAAGDEGVRQAFVGHHDRLFGGQRGLAQAGDRRGQVHHVVRPQIRGGQGLADRLPAVEFDGVPLAVAEADRLHMGIAGERPGQAGRGVLPAGEQDQSVVGRDHGGGRYRPVMIRSTNCRTVGMKPFE